MDFIVQELVDRGCDKIEKGAGNHLYTFRHRCQYYSIVYHFDKIKIQNLEIGKSCEYVVIINKDQFHKHFIDFLEPVRAKTLLWVATVLLGLHKRAVITANHPLRKLERGEFKEDEV